MKKIKEKMKDIFLYVLKNPRVIILIVMACAAFVFIINIVQARHERKIIEENGGEIVIEETYSFPDSALVDPIKNPHLYDTYKGFFGYHFNQSLIKTGSDSYKLLVLNEDCSYYLWDDYTSSALDFVCSGTYGTCPYKVACDRETQKDFQLWRDDNEADYEETFVYPNGTEATFYFYILRGNDPYDVQTGLLKNNKNGIVITKRNDALDESLGPNTEIEEYFLHFGFPKVWAKSATNASDLAEMELNIEDPIFNTYNVYETVICSKLDDNGDPIYKDGDYKTFVEIVICGSDSIYMGEEEMNSLDVVNKTLKNSNYQTVEEGKEFTKTLYEDIGYIF